MGATLLFHVSSRKAGSEEPAIHGITYKASVPAIRSRRPAGMIFSLYSLHSDETSGAGSTVILIVPAQASLTFFSLTAIKSPAMTFNI